MIKQNYDRLIRQLTKEVKNYYGDRLVSLVIFGSVARGTYRHDSDIDILIIAKGLSRGRMKRVNEFVNKIEKKLEDTIVALRDKGIFTEISPLIKTPEEALSGSPLFLDMLEDAKIIYDRNGFFKDILTKLGKKISTLGAKRVWKANAWYWDLKPDFKPGDVIEL
ncbi:MAG: nucleotidyltransferase domain-containing protein [Nitrospirae bacterium]|nr:nucleotidyltransferase domain-containing protein [Nitrospirota bacterium]